MIDRERILATDHEASLHAEARLRRLASETASSRTKFGTSPIARIGTGRRLDTGADPCGPAEARPA